MRDEAKLNGADGTASKASSVAEQSNQQARFKQVISAGEQAIAEFTAALAIFETVADRERKNDMGAFAHQESLRVAEMIRRIEYNVKGWQVEAKEAGFDLNA